MQLPDSHITAEGRTAAFTGTIRSTPRGLYVDCGIPIPNGGVSASQPLEQFVKNAQIFHTLLLLQRDSMQAVAASIGLRGRRGVLHLLRLLLLLVLVCRLTSAAAEGQQHKQPAHTRWWQHSGSLARPLRPVAAAAAAPVAASDRLDSKHAAAHHTSSSSSMSASSPADTAPAHPSRRLLDATDTTTSLSDSPALASDAASNSTSSTSNATSDAVARPSLNPWYDQHLLSSGGSGWGSGGLLYGMFNTSSKGPLLDPEGADAAAANTPQAAIDPPPYEYPPVGRHPTVFFTAVLLSFGSTTGLRPEEQLALSAAINAFLAPSPSAVITNTTVITQALAGSGLWLPCATAFFAANSASLQDYLAATLQSDPNLILPTATWGSVRTANIKLAQPAAPASISYSWAVGDYTNCSVMCGGGVQQRQVSCLDNYGNMADPSMCPPPAPTSSRSCQSQPCQASLPSSFALVLGAWSVCNSTCSYGGRTRSATCVSKEGYIGLLDNCDTSPEELSQQLWQSCTLPPCPTFIWSYSDWACDNTAGCGGGTASRNATCKLSSSSGQVVDASMCDEAQLDNSTQPCAQGPCVVFYWRAKELADCLPEEPLKPCGRYLQRRGFDCVNMTSSEVVTNNYCTGPKPVLGEVECSKPPEVDCSNGAPAAPAAAVPTTTLAAAAPPEADGGDGVTALPQAPVASASAGASSANSSSTSTASGANAPQQYNVAAVAMDGPSGSSSSSSDADSSGPASEPTASTRAGSSSSSSSSSSDAAADGSTPDSSNSTDGDAALPLDIGSSDSTADDSPTPSTDAGGSGGSAGSGGAGGSSSSSSSSQDLGPGAALPAWLLNDPTPSLKVLLECTGGYALSADGKCCAGTLLDAKGACCEAGAVDACGICNGTGRAIDSLGACCSAVLDAQGVCCTGAVDECGVCNGTNACDLKLELVAAVSPAVLFLVPASNANRRLRAALQEDVAAAVGSATGRLFDKSRVLVVLSAYSRVVQQQGSTDAGGSSTSSATPVPVAKPRPTATNSAISISEGWDGWDPEGDSSNQTLSGPAGGAAAVGPLAPSEGQAVAALPQLGGAATAAGSRPVQMDSVVAAPEQLDAPASHANLAAQRLASASTVEAVQRAAAAVERARRAAAGIAAAAESQQLQDLSPADSSTAGVPAEADAQGVMRRSLAQTDASSPDGVLDSSNAIRVSLTLKAPAAGTGADTGSTLLALNALVGTVLAIPGSRPRLTYKQVVSVTRAGTCGDGVCQVNERLSWNNPDSCQADCALPFLSCPPFDSAQPPCNGLGVCYNSIGSCACTKGYAGADCSSCAAGYKRVNGLHCVAAAVLAPQRACSGGVCAGNIALVVVPPPRSLVAGQVAVTVVVLLTMALVAGAAVLVYRGWYKGLLLMHAQEVAERARMAAD